MHQKRKFRGDEPNEDAKKRKTWNVFQVASIALEDILYNTPGNGDLLRPVGVPDAHMPVEKPESQVEPIRTPVCREDFRVNLVQNTIGGVAIDGSGAIGGNENADFFQSNVCGIGRLSLLASWLESHQLVFVRSRPPRVRTLTLCLMTDFCSCRQRPKSNCVHDASLVVPGE